MSTETDDSEPPPVWLWWLVGGLVLLVLVLVSYGYLRGSFSRPSNCTIDNVPSLDDPCFALSLEGLANSADTTGHLVGFWSEIDDIYAARNAAIASAKYLIQYETYFMTPGRRADAFAEVVTDRALAGVAVQLLLDHQGTKAMPEKYWRRLRNIGVDIQFFRPLDWRAPLEYNSRSHRKLLIIDGQRVYIGGAGVSDFWDGVAFEHDVAPWLDFDVAYEGEVVSLLQGKFLQNWSSAGGCIDLKQGLNSVQKPGTTPLFITDNTSSLNESSMRLLMQLHILAAKKRLWIGSPYLVPDDATIQALIRACQKGVDVRILTMGSATDKKMVHLASRGLYGPLLKAGIKICEHRPSMMHAKFVLVDDDWVSTGSANFDPRSYFHNDELNISGCYPELAQKVEQFFLKAMDNSLCLSYAEWQNRPRLEKIKGRGALLFKNLL
ncbi:phosphatidylserine/phosphatidylglycerophosphate/cardiolipin synthase family protein [Nodosilinea sp. LEGE 06152]|uniref:phospholipase D-like domain-containing protein n=1 Tax=Nodosilinea sp. LEGE 06152 TaxID=2777966 RepID=UPI001882D9E4|nr:phosphatidylserine/phosphatidylglycerophosphate/cardiolipin synthase family protein [Nodosilinea sp. LEGE 06152]MBE9157861.1 phosphatidylserine/phosphatidylglycerophosphate/cardiolipin synthase family protein [Nodosilinea sp. LEGE 06152]